MAKAHKPNVNIGFNTILPGILRPLLLFYGSMTGSIVSPDKIKGTLILCACEESFPVTFN